MTLEKSHALCHAAKAKLMKEFPEINEVLIHAEPYDAKAAAIAPKFGT